ncbi:hypothetical protein KJ972_03100 [Candidatus Micrarchaeota archaeon]|nr:hypothetical protein [Candidatus Micrarchaeota archaeon]
MVKKVLHPLRKKYHGHCNWTRNPLKILADLKNDLVTYRAHSNAESD